MEGGDRLTLNSQVWVTQDTNGGFMPRKWTLIAYSDTYWGNGGRGSAHPSASNQDSLTNYCLVSYWSVGGVSILQDYPLNMDV